MDQNVYTYNADQNSVTYNPGRNVDVNDILAYLDALLVDPEVEEGYVEICYASSSHKIDLTYSDCQALKESFGKLVAQKGLRCIIAVCTPGFNFGTNRMLKVVLEGIVDFKIVSNDHEVAEVLAHVWC